MADRTERPLGDGWFPADVTIIDTQTGESGMYLTWEKTSQDGWDGLEFDWGENNNSCDCNRANYLARAMDRPEDPSVRCGDARYRVDKIVDHQTGAVIYSETAVEAKRG